MRQASKNALGALGNLLNVACVTADARGSSLARGLLPTSWGSALDTTYGKVAAAAAKLPANTLVVNATSSGLKPGDPLPVDLAALPRPAAVFCRPASVTGKTSFPRPASWR